MLKVFRIRQTKFLKKGVDWKILIMPLLDCVKDKILYLRAGVTQEQTRISFSTFN